MKNIFLYQNHLKHLIFSLLLLLLGMISCKEETSYRTQILIQNETGSKITVQLFPKSEYLMEGRDDFYMYSDLGNGDYGDTGFEIGQNESNSIFLTKDLNLTSYNLALKIFDSIYIIPTDTGNAIMKFYPDTVIGYSENLFQDNQMWVYEKRNYNEPTNFKQNPVESDDYTFVISIDKK
jgi:hypothetical protein